ncbi:putative capsular polysaccharide synthesis family protein, partial [bacterium]|nr:putative capsular polysaccharide synthesis family protein [bacterium]
FQNLRIKPVTPGHSYNIKSLYGFEIDADPEDPDLNERLLELFLRTSDHETPLVFFDSELKGILNIDVFSIPFPKSRGYQIYEGERADVLLLRLENLNDCADVAFRDFLRLDGLELIPQNIGGQKAYGTFYQSFLNSIRLPQSYIDYIYDSKFTRHFYSPDEIGKFRAKWRVDSYSEKLNDMFHMTTR